MFLAAESVNASTDTVLIVLAFLLFAIAAVFFGVKRQFAHALMAAGLAFLTWALYVK
jgi:hypothetical protein